MDLLVRTPQACKSQALFCKLSKRLKSALIQIFHERKQILKISIHFRAIQTWRVDSEGVFDSTWSRVIKLYLALPSSFAWLCLWECSRAVCGARFRTEARTPRCWYAHLAGVLEWGPAKGLWLSPLLDTWGSVPEPAGRIGCRARWENTAWRLQGWTWMGFDTCSLNCKEGFGILR